MPPTPVRHGVKRQLTGNSSPPPQGDKTPAFPLSTFDDEAVTKGGIPDRASAGAFSKMRQPFSPGAGSLSGGGFGNCKMGFGTASEACKAEASRHSEVPDILKRRDFKCECYR